MQTSNFVRSGSESTPRRRTSGTAGLPSRADLYAARLARSQKCHNRSWLVSRLRRITGTHRFSERNRCGRRL